jgi:O-antigen/teichoic acid export membrane protein
MTQQSTATAPGGRDRTGSRPFLYRATTVMVLLTTLASVVNYASQIIFSRLLTPESYGDLTALLALMIVAAVPTGAAQTVVADRIATHMANGNVDAARYLIRHAVAHVAMVSLVLGVIYSLSLPLVIPALNLQSAGPAFALIPLLVLAFFMPTAFGILQGLERFVALGLVMLAIALSRILFGVPWSLAGGGAGGPLAGMTIGMAMTLAIVFWIVRDVHLPRGSGAATTGLRRRIDRRAATATGAFIAFALLSNLDVVLAKLFLTPTESGHYAALVTVEKILIFLPGAVAMVMVPSAARARVSDGSAARMLRIAALLVVLSTVAAGLPAALAPETVLRVMFGEEYVAARDGMLPIVLAGAGLALLYLLVVYTVAIQSRHWVWVLAIAVVGQVGGISLFHASVTEIATVQAVVIVGALVVNELVFHPLLASRRLLRPSAGLD